MINADNIPKRHARVTQPVSNFSVHDVKLMLVLLLYLFEGILPQFVKYMVKSKIRLPKLHSNCIQSIDQYLSSVLMKIVTTGMWIRCYTVWN